MLAAATKTEPELKPMGIPASLLFFGLPALLFVAGFHVLMPWLIARGVMSYYAYLTGLGLPLFILVLLSLLWLRLEGRAVDWHTMRDRFRLGRMDLRAWLWSAAALLAGPVVGFGLVKQVTNMLIHQGIIPVPTWLPAFTSPLVVVDPIAAMSDGAGGLRGNWLSLVAMVVVFFFNIIGEEFWWRGVVLPRQEKAFGEWAWVVHGTLWALFHIYKWWDVLNLLPITLALSFVCSKLRKTTPGIVIHGVTNGVALIPMALAVLGVIG